MNRRRIVPIVIVVLLVLGAAGWYWWSSRATVDPGTVVVSGTVDANQVQVTSLLGGRVVKAELAEGNAVNGGVTLYRIDDSALKLQVDQAAAGVRAANAAYKQAVKDDESKADIAAAKAQLDQARAAEQIARIQLGYATISSPATGTVTSIAIAEGELASPGRTMATITKTGSLFVRSFVPEPQIGQVAIGDTATLLTDGGTTTDAKVTFIASQAQFTPSNVETKDQRAKLVYEVRLEPVSPEGLTPGMPVTVTIAK
jgi:HlyD family secretion protein